MHLDDRDIGIFNPVIAVLDPVFNENAFSLQEKGQPIIPFVYPGVLIRFFSFDGKNHYSAEFPVFMVSDYLMVGDHCVKFVSGREMVGVKTEITIEEFCNIIYFIFCRKGIDVRRESPYRIVIITAISVQRPESTIQQ